LRLGLEGQVVRKARLCPQCGVIVGKPRLGHIQPPSDQGIAFDAGIAQIDPDLTIGDFADGTTVLRSDPDRVVALFDDPRLIDQHDSIGRTERVGHQVLVASDHRCSAPGALADEMLQVTHVHRLRQGDPLDRFPRLRAQQALQVDRRPRVLFGAPKRRGKVGVIGRQSIDKLLDITRCQVAFWWRAGCWYNNGWHRYPPQLI